MVTQMQQSAMPDNDTSDLLVLTVLSGSELPALKVFSSVSMTQERLSIPDEVPDFPPATQSQQSSFLLADQLIQLK